MKAKVNNLKIYTKDKAIHVTNHAITQYKIKMFSPLEYTEIHKILETIVRKGTIECKRPGNAWSMGYNGISIVIAQKENTITVITCLGNKHYKTWASKNEIYPRYKDGNGNRKVRNQILMA